MTCNEPAETSRAASIIPDEPGEVYADKAYDALSAEKAIKAKGGTSKADAQGAIAGCRLKGLRRIIVRCGRSAQGLKTQLPFSFHAMDRACQGQVPSPSRRHCLQHQALLADANRLSGPQRGSQNRPPAKPVRRRPLTAQPAIFKAQQSQTAVPIIQGAPSRSTRQKATPAHRSRNNLVRLASYKNASGRATKPRNPAGPARVSTKDRRRAPQRSAPLLLLRSALPITAGTSVCRSPARSARGKRS
jgi:hypothetical protein